MRTDRLMPGIRALAVAGFVFSAAATLAHASAYGIDNQDFEYALIEDGSNTRCHCGRLPYRLAM